MRLFDTKNKKSIAGVVLLIIIIGGSVIIFSPINPNRESYRENNYVLHIGKISSGNITTKPVVIESERIGVPILYYNNIHLFVELQSLQPKTFSIEGEIKGEMPETKKLIISFSNGSYEVLKLQDESIFRIDYQIQSENDSISRVVVALGMGHKPFNFEIIAISYE